MEFENKVLLFVILVTIVVTTVFVWVAAESWMPDASFTMEIVNDEPCELDLCKTRGTTTYCMGFELTGCEAIIEKCEHQDYLDQWNMKCK